MFDFVRKHTKVMQFVLFLLIVPSFVIVGVSGYNQMSDKGATVAVVDGRDISQADWDNAHKAEVDRLRQQMPNLDAQLLDSPEMKYTALERIIHDRVLDAAARDSRITASDARVAREIASNPVIQSLRGPDGKLDMARYRQLLTAQGMTPEMFEAQVRADLSARQVLGALGNSAFATPAITNVGLGAYFEKREVQVVNFPAADYASRVNPTDAEIEAFYKANPQMFQAPEQATIEYVMLDLPSVTQSIAVNEQDVKSYYEQNASRYAVKEQRRASHILVNAPKNAPPAEREKAKKKAEELLAAAKANPAGFAELARKNSQDPGSAANGGDLDWFGRGAMVKPFEDAVFSMKPGDITLVETEFGYHVIRMVEAREGKQKSFEDVRAELEAELKKQQAQRKYAESAEVFSNTVYEQADTLKPVAEKLKLELKTAANVGRQPAPGATGPLANPKFLQALFSPDAIEKKRNTEAMDLGANQMVSGRVVQYTPARTRPLDEVKADVRSRLVARRAGELAKKEGQEKLAAWQKTPAEAAMPPAAVISRADPQKLPPKVIDAALRTDPTKLPAFTGVDLGNDGFAVVKVNKVIPREAPAPQQAKAEQAQFARVWSTAEGMAYYELLKERFGVTINVPKPTPAATSTQ